MKTRYTRASLIAVSGVAWIALAFGLGTGPLAAQQNSDKARRPAAQPQARPRPPADPDSTVDRFREARSIDGSGNNLSDPALGAADTPMIRLTGAHYADDSGTPAGPDRPGTRAVSNAVVAQTVLTENAAGATDWLWQWGQFLDHDLDETPTHVPEEAFDIPVPAGDPWFDPEATGTKTIPLNRSAYEIRDGVREQVNGITAFIDASQVYGSDAVRAFGLRRMDGSGMLKSSVSEHGELLPYNEDGLPNAPSAAASFFVAGDIRVNEQAALMAVQTLFLREHNSWAKSYAAKNPAAGDEEIYQFARMMVGAEMQAITYREFLPVLLGPNALPPYRGYRPEVDPSIANEFATAAYRIGHSLLSPVIRRIGADGESIEAGDLSLAAAFFNPALIEDHGIEPILRGLAAQRCQELDGMIVDEVRNFLFGAPGSPGFDLAALNLQRGRDHGLPSLNEARAALGFRTATRFDQITGEAEVAGKLASVYSGPDQVDLWIGGLCEPHVRGSMVGPVFRRILADQFTRLRDGDRFWYEKALPRELVDLVHRQTLATIIRRNTEIGDELPDNVFRLPLANRRGR